MSKGFSVSKLTGENKEEVEGVWTEYAPGFSVKVARFGNSKFEKISRRLRRPMLKRLRRGGEFSEDIADEIVMAAAAQTILLDWEGLVDDDEKPIPFSEEKALALFKESRRFYSEVLEISREAALFDEELHEESAKNL